MADEILLPGAVLSLSAQAADRLVAAANGDAALLYLWLLRQNGKYDPAAAVRALRWGPDRAHTAFTALVSLSLATREQEEATPAPPPEPAEPPEYSAADISRELDDKASPFPALVGEVQRRLGKILSTTDLKQLYTLYDYLALPAEVILLLVNWCCEENERKYGPGSKPRLSQIQKEGFVWRRLGVDTVEAAEEHLKRQAARRDRESVLLPLVGIYGRGAVEGERKYLSAWMDMGFGDEAIRLAYERTVLKKQSMNWAYMNSILRSWHQKGLHTVEEVRTGDSDHARPQQGRSPAPQKTPGQEREDVQWMKDFLARQQAEEQRKGEG